MPEVQMLLEFERPPDAQIPLLTPDEIYGNASQSFLLKLREDNRIEWKPSGAHRELLATYFSMWANTAPEGGLIAIGIADNDDDDGRDGCSDLSQDRLNWLDKVGREFCPDARYDTKRISWVRDDGTPDFIVLIRVYYREDKVVET